MNLALLCIVPQYCSRADILDPFPVSKTKEKQEKCFLRIQVC